MKKKIKKRPILVVMYAAYILMTLASLLLIYGILKISNVENIIRYLSCFLIFLVLIYTFLSCIKVTLRGKNALILVYSVLFILLFAGMGYIASIVNDFYGKISSFKKDTYKVSASLITLKNNSNTDIKNIKNEKIGIIKNNNEEFKTISDEIISKNNLSSNKLVEFENINDAIKSLYNNEINYVVVSSDYVSLLSNVQGYNNIKDETYEIITNSKEFKKENTSDNLSSDDPFTVLILGMDSTVSDISKVTSFNSDTLMLITFNPKTYNATILSIPRDTYVPISCQNNRESKITHSGWGGEKCVISTIENWTGININYYAKVNFTALVKLVDELKGIEVNVPYSFCEQDSQRRWDKNTVYVKKGLQNLTGEQALALSRNRHPNPDKCSSEWTNYYSDDIVRGENQQLVLNALINKMTKNLDLNKMYKLLDIIGKNVDTNMSINEMTNYYNLLKDISVRTLSGNKNAINFEKLHISTYGQYIYDSLLNMAGISMQIYYKDSFNAVVNEMNINLGKKDPELIKNINFSINTPYKEKVVGTGNFSQNEIETFPNFIGKDLSVLTSYAQAKGLKLDIEYINDINNFNNIITYQNIPSTYRLDWLNTNTIKVKVVNNDTITQTVPTE